MECSEVNLEHQTNGMMSVSATGIQDTGTTFTQAIKDATRAFGRLENTMGSSGIYVGDPCRSDYIAVGDRIRVREGYDHAGDVGTFTFLSSDKAGRCVVEWEGGFTRAINVVAIEPYPLTVAELHDKAFQEKFGRPMTDEERFLVALGANEVELR